MRQWFCCLWLVLLGGAPVFGQDESNANRETGAAARVRDCAAIIADVAAGKRLPPEEGVLLLACYKAAPIEDANIGDSIIAYQGPRNFFDLRGSSDVPGMLSPGAGL